MRCLLSAALALLLAAPAGAEIVTVPLELQETPSYLGEPGNIPLVLPFDAGRSLANVTDVGLRVVATTSFVRLHCWQFGDYGGGVRSGPDVLGFSAAFLEDGAVLTQTTFVYDPADHPGETILVLDSVLVLDPADWSFLADGRGTLELQGLDCAADWSYPTVCICDASFVLAGVELVFGLGESVPATDTAWGALKARYR